MVNNEAIEHKVDVLTRKVDQALRYLTGDGDVPGLMQRMGTVERLLFGKDEDKEGLIFHVNQVRRWHNWLLGTLSAIGGAGLTLLVQYAIKHL